MTNNLKNYVFDTEDVFEDKIQSKNIHLKKALTNVIDKLLSLSAEEWGEIFELMNSNSLGGRINVKEAYIVAFSKMLLNFAVEINYMFAQFEKKIFFYNSIRWTIIEQTLLKEFFKAAAKKIGIPEYTASSVSFVNKLHKQFMQDAYFEKEREEDSNYINLQNGILTISKYGVKLEEHHPKYFLEYILDFEYIENSNNDNLIELLGNFIPSVEIQKTLQQAISQVLVKNYNNDKKICLYGLNKAQSASFINTLEEVIPKEIISNYFKNENAKFEDLFIDYENILKDAKSLEKIIFIPCEVVLEDKNIEEIKNNKSEIFNWIIEGTKEIIKTKKIYISKECENFKERFNVINLFVQKTNFIKTENNSKSIVTTYENVYKQYLSFCELHDEEQIGRGYFNRELKALGFEATRRETGNVWFAKFA